jgi:hypothetical protein
MKEQHPIDKIRQFTKKTYADSTVKELSFHTFEKCRKLVKAAAIIAGPLALTAKRCGDLLPGWQIIFPIE